MREKKHEKENVRRIVFEKMCERYTVYLLGIYWNIYILYIRLVTVNEVDIFLSVDIGDESLHKPHSQQAMDFKLPKNAHTSAKLCVSIIRFRFATCLLRSFILCIFYGNPLVLPSAYNALTKNRIENLKRNCRKARNLFNLFDFFFLHFKSSV